MRQKTTAPHEKQLQPDPSRRALLKATGATLLLGLFEDAARAKRKSAKKGRRASRSNRSRAHTNPAPISGESLFRDVINYYNIGEHRAGTEADQQTSDWIARELRSSGV